MPLQTQVDADTVLTLVEEVGKIKDYNKKRKGTIDTALGKLDTSLETFDTALGELRENICTQKVQAEINMFQAGAATGPMGSSDELIPKFYGRKGEDFSSWVDIFDLTANAYNFDAVRKAKVLPAYLRETALQKYKALTNEVQENYTQLTAALRDALKPAEQKRWAQGRLAEIQQSENEPVQVFATQLQKLVKLAHPELTQDHRNGMLLTYFTSKLHPNLRQWVQAFECQTYDEALSKANCLEANKMIEGGQYPTPRIAAVGASTDNETNGDMFLNEPQVNASSAVYTQAYERRPNFNKNIGASTQRQFSGNQKQYQKPSYQDEQGAISRIESMIKRMEIDNNANQSRYQNNYRRAPMQQYRSSQYNRSNYNSRPFRDSYNQSWGQQYNGSQQQNSNNICHYCGKQGHWKRECRSRKNSINPYMGKGKENRPPKRGPNINVIEQNHPLRHEEKDNVLQDITEEMNSLREQNKRLQERLWTDTNDKAQPQRLNMNAIKVNVNSKEQPNELHAPTDTSMEPIIKKAKLATTEQQKSNIKNEKQTTTKTTTKWVPKFDTFVLITLIVLLALLVNIEETVAKPTPPSPNPMLCGGQSGGRLLYRLPRPIPCGQVQHADADVVNEVKLELYKQNIVESNVPATACQIAHQHSETYTYLMGQEHWKKDTVTFETTSVEACRQMARYQRCSFGPMINEGGFWKTQNKHIVKWGNWHFHCCTTYVTDTYNCILHNTQVIKRHNSPFIETTAGDASNCKWTDHQCTLPDGTALLWQPENIAECERVYFKTVRGKRLGDAIIIDDGSMAFTFSTKETVNVCDIYSKQQIANLTDQGVAVRIIDEWKMSPPPTQQTKLSQKQKRDLGVVDSSQLASTLQYLEIVTRQNIQFTFRTIMAATCIAMNAITQALYNSLLESPSIGARTLLGTQNLFARSSFGFLEVYPCELITNYTLLPQKESCSEFIPIKFKLQEKDLTGWLSPHDLIIHNHEGQPQDCTLATTVPLQLGTKFFLYRAENGQITEVLKSEIPEIPHILNNFSSKLNLKSSVFKEIVMNNFSDFQSKITLSDIAKSVTWRRKLFKSIGLDPTGTPTGAETAGWPLLCIPYDRPLLSVLSMYDRTDQEYR